MTKQLPAEHCNVDLQTEIGNTPLHLTAFHGQAAVTEELLAARCNVDLKANNGSTALQVAERQGHTGIATLIRNQKHKSADRGKKDTRPAQTKKQQEDADRSMKVLLEEEDKDAAAAAAVSQKKRQAKGAVKERLAETLPTDKTGGKRRNTPRSRRIRRGQRQRLFLGRTRLRV